MADMHRLSRNYLSYAKRTPSDNVAWSEWEQAQLARAILNITVFSKRKSDVSERGQVQLLAQSRFFVHGKMLGRHTVLDNFDFLLFWRILFIPLVDIRREDSHFAWQL